MQKLPKKPKASASLKVWENYQKKLAAIKKKQQEKVNAEKKKENLIKTTEKLRSTI